MCYGNWELGMGGNSSNHQHDHSSDMGQTATVSATPFHQSMGYFIHYLLSSYRLVGRPVSVSCSLLAMCSYTRGYYGLGGEWKGG